MDACVVEVLDRVFLLGLSDDPVIGDTDDAGDDAQIRQGGGYFFFFMSAAFHARQTAICFTAFELSLSEYMHARIP